MSFQSATYWRTIDALFSIALAPHLPLYLKDHIHQSAMFSRVIWTKVERLTRQASRTRTVANMSSTRLTEITWEMAVTATTASHLYIQHLSCYKKLTLRMDGAGSETQCRSWIVAMRMDPSLKPPASHMSRTLLLRAGICISSSSAATAMLGRCTIQAMQPALTASTVHIPRVANRSSLRVILQDYTLLVSRFCPSLVKHNHSREPLDQAALILTLRVRKSYSMLTKGRVQMCG